MPTSQRLGDRRAAVRFEIVGELWGTLQVAQTVKVLNLSAGGMLIESPVTLAPGSLYDAHVTIDDRHMVIPVRATRVTPLMPGSAVCTAAFEFVELPSDVRNVIDRLVGEQPDESPAGEP